MGMASSRRNRWALLVLAVVWFVGGLVLAPYGHTPALSRTIVLHLSQDFRW